MGTGIRLFLHWENGIWVIGTGNHKLTKLGMGNMSFHCTAYVINAQ